MPFFCILKAVRTILKLLILPLVLTTVTSAQQREVDVKFGLAQSFERNNDWEKAVKFYTELYANDSMNIVLYESLRRCFLQLKRYDDAVHLIQTRLRFRPNDITVMAQLGIVYARAEENEKSVSTWNRAINTDRRNPSTYRVVANAAIESRMLDPAIDFYLRGRAECGDPSLFAADLAYLNSMMMNYAEATKEYLILIRQSPAQLPFVQSRIAGYTNRSDGLNAATIVVENASRASAENIAIHQLLAWLLMEGKQFEKAFDVYVRIDRSTKAGGREIYSFAERALKEKAFSTATSAFKMIIEKYPKFDRLAAAKFGYASTVEESAAPSDTSFLLIGSNPIGFGHGSDPFGPSEVPTNETQSRYGEAIAAYTNVLQEYPGTELAARALYRIATIKFERLFNVDDAIATLRQLVRGYGRFPAILAYAAILLGDALLAKGDLGEAAKQYRSILSFGDAVLQTKEIAQNRVAEVEFFQGNFQEATRLLQELTRNPDSDVANDALSLLIFLEENSTKSRAELKELARATMFIRQRKLPEALVIVESIQKQYPQSQLADEALMLMADIFITMIRFADGIGAYTRLINQFPESILLDKAQMKIGHVYQWKLNDKLKAIAAYQSLLEKFPNSMYAKEARKRIRELRGDSL